MNKLFCIAVSLMIFFVLSCASNGGTGAKPPPDGNTAATTETTTRAAMSLDEAVAQAAADISGKLPKGTKIAVVSFASESAQISGYLMEEINFALLDKGLVVADRASLESVRKELNFHMSGEVSDETAQSIGKFLGVEFVITGQFVFTGTAYRFRVTTERTETAERIATSNLNVRNDSRTKSLVEALNKTTIQTHSAGY
jgi:TolB-like protein